MCFFYVLIYLYPSSYYQYIRGYKLAKITQIVLSQDKKFGQPTSKAQDFPIVHKGLHIYSSTFLHIPPLSTSFPHWAPCTSSHHTTVEKGKWMGTRLAPPPAQDQRPGLSGVLTVSRDGTYAEGRGYPSPLPGCCESLDILNTITQVKALMCLASCLGLL